MEYCDILGKRVGKLVVNEHLGGRRVGVRQELRQVYNCKCDCGSEVVVQRSNLLRQHTKSCGCLKKQKGSNNKDWMGCGELSGRFWSQICDKANVRNIPVHITIEDAWMLFVEQNGKCALTGLSIEMPKNKKDNYKHTASLDRIDSDIGYTVDNIQWVHKDVNRMKSDLSSDRFTELCCLVAEGINQ